MKNIITQGTADFENEISVLCHKHNGFTRIVKENVPTVFVGPPDAWNHIWPILNNNAEDIFSNEEKIETTFKIIEHHLQRTLSKELLEDFFMRTYTLIVYVPLHNRDVFIREWLDLSKEYKVQTYWHTG
ncbi:MAG: hypothetical protein WCJ81_01385 [bacterium]